MAHLVEYLFNVIMEYFFVCRKIKGTVIHMTVNLQFAAAFSNVHKKRCQRYRPQMVMQINIRNIPTTITRLLTGNEKVLAAVNQDNDFSCVVI